MQPQFDNPLPLPPPSLSLNIEYSMAHMGTEPLAHGLSSSRAPRHLIRLTEKSEFVYNNSSHQTQTQDLSMRGGHTIDEAIASRKG